MKKYATFILVILILVMLLIISGKRNQELSRENERKTQNIETLNGNIYSFKIALKEQDSINAARVTALTYTVDEFKRFRASDVETINSLKIRLKNVLNVSNIGTKTNEVIKTQIIYKDSAKCLNYSDNFTTISGCFKGDSINLSVENRDSLTTIVNSIPKHHFLWLSWGIKAIQLNITSKNPNTTFTYLKYIELK